MDEGRRRIQRKSNAEVKGSKPISAHPNRSINTLAASMDAGPRVNYSLGAQRTNGESHAAPPRNRPGIPNSSSTATHGVRASKTGLQNSAENGKRTTPKEGALNVQARDRTSKEISRNNIINLLERSYRMGVSVDSAGLGTRIKQEAAAKRGMGKLLHPVQGLLDPVAKPATELEVRRSSLGKLANTNLRRASRCVELPAMQWPPSAEEIKCSVSDVDMEIVAGSVADAVRAIVMSADMPSRMQIHAFRWARRLCDIDDIRHLALTLKKEFDRNYGPAWHCIVGNSFGSFVTHSPGGFLCFSIQNMSILLFRTSVPPLERI